MRQSVGTPFLVSALGLLSVIGGALLAWSADQQGPDAPTPACALLSVAEIRQITRRQDYPDHRDGDAPGEGLGGGSSCQYGGETFMPGEHPPLISVVLIPVKSGQSWTVRRRGSTLSAGCHRESVSGIGEDAFVEFCPQDRGPTLFVKAGAHDLVVQIDAKPPATAASVRPTVIAVAKAAVAKLR